MVKNSVLHDFGFGKVSRIHETFLMELQLFGWRHFSKIEVMQNSVLTLISLISVEVGINVKAEGGAKVAKSLNVEAGKKNHRF